MKITITITDTPEGPNVQFARHPTPEDRKIVSRHNQPSMAVMLANELERYILRLAGPPVEESKTPEPAPAPLQLAPGARDTWHIHTIGTEQLQEAPDEITALRYANMLNIGIARGRLNVMHDPGDPWVMVVIERNGVDYSKDQYPDKPPTDSSPTDSAAG